MSAAVGTIVLDVSDWAPALRAEYAEILRRRLGAPFTSDELSEWLAAVERRNRAHAGEPVADPEAEAAAGGLLDRVVSVPGTRLVLHVPTMAAEIRIEAVQRDVVAGRLTHAQALRRIVYCIAHGADRDALAELAVPERATRAVEEWASCELTCSEATLEDALSHLRKDLYPQPDGTDDGAAIDWPDLAANAAKHCGGTPEHWLYEAPLSQAIWLLRAVARRQRRQERAIAEAQGRALPMDPDAPEVRAIGAYRELAKRLKEMPEMKRKTIELDGGRKIEVREMTWGELRRVQAEGETLPMEWPIEQQFAGREKDLDGLGVSELRTLAEAVYRLSLAPAAGATGGLDETPAGAGNPGHADQPHDQP